MEEKDETSPLISSSDSEDDKLRSNGTGGQEKSTSNKSGVSAEIGVILKDDSDTEQPKYTPRCLITVEPYLFLYSFSLFGFSPLLTQYVYMRIAEEKGFVSNSSTQDDQSLCVHVNTSSAEYILQQQIQAESSDWNMYFSICSTIPSIVVTIFYGGYSDKGGRRLSLLLPVAGGLLKLSAFVIGIYFNWPLWTFLIVSFVEGLFGQYATALMAAFAYVADISTSKNKALRILIAESALLVAAAVSNMTVGVLIKAFPDFVAPTAILAGSLLLCLLYTIPFLPELVEKDPSARLIDFSNALQVGKLFFHTADEREPGRVWKLRLLLLIFFLTAIPAISTNGLDMLLVMNSPLCWDSEHIGFYNAVKFLGYQIAAFFGIYSMRKWLKMSEVSIAIVACVSALGSRILFSVAQTDAMIYIESIVGCLFTLGVPMLRTAMSKLVTDHEQGVLFASIAFTESGCSLFGGTVFNSIYAATVGWFRGFVQLTIGALYLLSVILLSVYNWRIRVSSPGAVFVDVGDRKTPQTIQ